MLQNTEYLWFYITHSFLRIFLQNTPKVITGVPSRYFLEVWSKFTEFVQLTDFIFKQELRNLSDVMTQYLLIMTEKSMPDTNNTRPRLVSEDRLSQEVKAELNMLIEADKSIDEEEKQYHFKRQKFVQEYWKCIEYIFSLTSNDADIDQVMSLPYLISKKTKSMIEHIHKDGIIHQIQEAITRGNIMFNSDNIVREKHLDIIKFNHKHIWMPAFQLKFEDEERLEPYLNQQYFHKIIVLSQKQESWNKLTEM